MVRNTIPWDTVEGASIDPARHGLWIATVPRVHLRIRRLLDWIAESFSRQVAVDVVAVPARPGDVVHLATAGRPLAPKAAQELLTRAPWGRARLVGSDVGRIVQLDGEELHYLGDYDVEISGRAKIGRPVTRRLFRGFAVEIRPCLADGTRGVVLHCRLQRTQVKRPLSKHETEHGDVELPEMLLTRLNTSFWVPLGRTTIVGGTTTGEEPVLLLVTPHRLR